MNGNNILSEKTKAKLKGELVRIGRVLAASFLNELSNSLDSFYKDIAAKISESATSCPEKSNTEEVETK